MGCLNLFHIMDLKSGSFYNGLRYPSKVSLDSSTRGALIYKQLGEAYDVIESVAINHHQWGNDRAHNPRKIFGGKFDIDGVDLIMDKLDAFNQCFDKLEMRNETVSFVDIRIVICAFRELPGHATMSCQYGVSPSQEAQVNHVDAFCSVSYHKFG